MDARWHVGDGTCTCGGKDTHLQVQRLDYWRKGLGHDNSVEWCAQVHHEYNGVLWVERANYTVLDHSSHETSKSAVVQVWIKVYVASLTCTFLPQFQPEAAGRQATSLLIVSCYSRWSTLVRGKIVGMHIEVARDKNTRMDL